MIARRDYENKEKVHLSPWACFSMDTKGRREQEEECSIRTPFQRDRDRIIHSKAFRRLKHKTQVFIAPEEDHYRTRLTHTLEVQQVARTIGRGLGLNEDLIEAICLGHDLGHTPFGHAGEDALNKVLEGGFRHNTQSLRVVDHLESLKTSWSGLNLTHEVRDGIVNHTGSVLPETLEGQVSRLADRIAYINHDVDDAIRGHILTRESLPKEAIDVLGESHSQRINTMVVDMIEASWGQDTIGQSPAVAQATDCLREFLFANVYVRSRAKKEEEKVAGFLQSLFHYYVDHPGELPEEYLEQADIWGIEQVVVDYIAGMSDRYALNQGQKLLIPQSWYTS